MRLTKDLGHGIYTVGDKLIDGYTMFGEPIIKLGQLEDLEEELGVDLVEFLTECKHVLKSANHVIGYTSKGIEITTDFGYVDQFIDEMKKALRKEVLK